MKTGEELALSAMEKELKRLTRLSNKAKEEADECMNVGSELISIHEDFSTIVKSNDDSKTQLKKLDSLKTRADKAEKIRKKDLIKMFDKQNETESARHALAHEVSLMKFRLSHRR